VTDVDRFFAEGAQVVGERIGRAAVQPAGTLLEGFHVSPFRTC
jgi:hypothetical protein